MQPCFLKKKRLSSLNLTLQTLLMLKDLRNISRRLKKYLVSIKTIKTLFKPYFKISIKNNKLKENY